MSKKAFSLVELSIVLAIIGLLTGGILTGQNLLKAAELRSVITEYNAFSSAAIMFKDNYGGLAGDLPNAVDYWGAADGGDGEGSDCFYAISIDEKTCNGDGDGDLDAYSSMTTGGDEVFRFWQHLANAGYIDGKFTGAPKATVTAENRQASLGVNIPASKFGQVGWYASSNATITGTADWLWPGYYEYYFSVGEVESTDIAEAPGFTPKQAWTIDSKIDDGLPGLGKVVTYVGTGDCNTASDGGDKHTAEYKLSNTNKACVMVFTY